MYSISMYDICLSSASLYNIMLRWGKLKKDMQFNSQNFPNIM